MTASPPSRLKLQPCSGFSLMTVLCVAGLVSAILIGWLVCSLGGGTSYEANHSRPLTLLAAAGLRGPVEAITAEYQREHGAQVHVQFGGSNSLLNQLQVDQISTPDLFLAADESYARLAVQHGLAKEILPVATQRPVVIVNRASTIVLRSLDDLWVDGLRLSIGDPDQASIGRTVKAALVDGSPPGVNLWNKLEHQVTQWGVFKPTVNDVANDVQLGNVDAGIVWNTTVASPAYASKLKVIELPEFSGRAEQVSLVVLASSRQRQEALKFVRYLTASEHGLAVFYAHGFGPVQGLNGTRVSEGSHSESAAQALKNSRDASSE